MKKTHTKAAIIRAAKEAACAVMRVTMAELEGKRRYPRIAWARHVAIYVSRKMSGASHPELSRAFGFADHNSSIYSCQVVLARLRTARQDSPFTLDVTDVEKHAKGDFAPMDELFPVESVSVNSPRLEWMKRHNVETEKVRGGGPGVESPETGEAIPAWVCRIKKDNPDSACYNEREIGSGDTELDAIADFACNAGIPLWNEEGLK